jgi:hypothetical protein
MTTLGFLMPDAHPRFGILGHLLTMGLFYVHFGQLSHPPQIPQIRAVHAPVSNPLDALQIEPALPYDRGEVDALARCAL